MKGRFLLNIVVRKGASVFELLASKDETLLIRGDTFLILNLRFDIVDCVRRFDLQGDRLARQGFDEDLHASTKTKNYLVLDFILT